MKHLDGYIYKLPNIAPGEKAILNKNFRDAGIEVERFSIHRASPINCGAFKFVLKIEGLEEIDFYIQEFPGCCAYVTIDNVVIRDYRDELISKAYESVIKMSQVIGWTLHYTFIIFTTVSSQDINRSLNKMGAIVFNKDVSVRSKNAISMWKLGCAEIENETNNLH